MCVAHIVRNMNAEATTLQDARVARGLSQSAAAELVGLHQSTWSRIERGEQQPRGDVLRRIIDEFGVTAESVLFPSIRSRAA